MSKMAFTSKYASTCQDAIESLDDRLVIHTYDDYKGKPAVRVSDSTKENDLKYASILSTPPMAVRWEDLSGMGNFQSQFAQEKHQAKYSATLTVGKLDVLQDASEAEALEEWQEQWFTAMEALEKRVLKHMFDTNMCPKKKKAVVQSAKKAVARMRSAAAKDISNDDPEMLDMALDAWYDGANRVISNDRDTDAKQFKAKAKVFVRDYDNKDANAEKINMVGIVDVATDTVLNKDNNDDKYVHRGDLVGVDFQLKPYILPSGVYGISVNLRKLHLIQKGEGGGGGGKRKRKVNYGACVKEEPSMKRTKTDI